MKVICSNSKCKKDFDVFKNNIKVQKIGKIKKHYFMCPNCKEEYVINYYDWECEKLEKVINKLRMQLKKNIETKNIKNLNAIDKKIKEKRNQLKNRMEILNKEYNCVFKNSLR